MDSALKKYKIIASFFLVAALAGTNCGGDKNEQSPGKTYIPDMVYSPSPQEYTPVLKDSFPISPPNGTVPVEYIPYPLKKNDSDRALASKHLTYPDIKTLSDGKDLYTIYCSNCHSTTGDGKGKLFLEEKYTYPPASLLSEKMHLAKASDIFHVITVGKGLMVGQASNIEPQERWQIANYIKTVLQKND